MTGDAFGLILMRRSPRKTYWTELVHRSARNAVRFGLRTVGSRALLPAPHQCIALARAITCHLSVLELELRRHGRRKDFIRRAFCEKDLWSGPAMVAPQRGLTDQNWNDHVAGGAFSLPVRRFPIANLPISLDTSRAALPHVLL